MNIVNEETEYRSGMIQDRGIRVFTTLKNVKMHILGEDRVIPELRVSFTEDGKMCLSFDEYNRVADVIHEELRHKRKVYSENR